jgi:cell division transport system permease protein
MIITMTVSLTLLGSSVVLYWQVNDMRNVYYQQIEVSIFLKVTDTTQAQKDAIEADLNADMQPGGLVDHWEFETKQQAYDNFKVIFASVPELTELTKPESLPESYRVKLRDPNNFDAFKDKYQKFIGDGGVQRIIDQKALVDQVFSVLGSLQKLALIIAIVQGVAALMLVINTIQVAAYSKRREVAVMKLVGASNWFVRVPFMAEGLVQGAIGAGFAVGLVYFLKWIITKLLHNQHTLLQPFYASSHDVVVIGILVLAIGAGIGIIGSMIGLRRFLEA